MKKLFPSLLLIVSLSAFGQIKPKGQDWFFYDLTHDMLLNAPEGVESDLRSNGHSLSLMYDYAFGNSNFGIGIGLGFTSNNHYTNLLASVSDTGTGVFQVDTASNFKSNKLTTQFIEIPFELRFRGKLNDKGNFFRLYVGAKVGIRVNAYSKFKNDDVNVRYYHFEELNRFRYGVYARIGFSYFSVYGYYGLSDIFESGNTTDGQAISPIRPLSVGLSISL